MLESLENMVRTAAEARGYAQTLKALPLMKAHHRGQTRKGAAHAPYIVHPLTMACHALAMGIADDVLLTVILMHDVCEDCGVDARDLPFSDAAKDGIAAMTHIEDFTIPEAEDMRRYYAQIRGNKYACITKLIDRCNNVSEMSGGFSKIQMADYITETETYVMPLLAVVREKYPEYKNACFLLEYHLRSVVESLGRVV